MAKTKMDSSAQMQGNKDRGKGKMHTGASARSDGDKGAKGGKDKMDMPAQTIQGMAAPIGRDAAQTGR